MVLLEYMRLSGWEMEIGLELGLRECFFGVFLNKESNDFVEDELQL